MTCSTLFLVKLSNYGIDLLDDPEGLSFIQVSIRVIDD